MIRYIVSRLVSLSLSLIVASLVIFLVIEVIPGDPAAYMLGLNADPAAVAALRAELGLDGSVVTRYLAWVSGMLVGDFGISYTYRVPVIELISARLWVSLPLTLYALVLSTAIAIPVGMLAAARRGQSADVAVMGTTQLGIAVPNFWFAMMLVLIFCGQSALVLRRRVSGLGGGDLAQHQGADAACRSHWRCRRRRSWRA